MPVKAEREAFWGENLALDTRLLSALAKMRSVYTASALAATGGNI